LESWDGFSFNFGEEIWREILGFLGILERIVWNSMNFKDVGKEFFELRVLDRNLMGSRNFKNFRKSGKEF